MEQRKVFTMATLTALGINEALKGLLTPDQLAAVDQRVRSGGAEVAILVKHDGARLRLSVGLLAAGSPELFETPILRVEGSMDAALVPSDQVTVTDLSKLN